MARLRRTSKAPNSQRPRNAANNPPVNEDNSFELNELHNLYNTLNARIAYITQMVEVGLEIVELDMLIWDLLEHHEQLGKMSAQAYDHIETRLKTHEWYRCYIEREAWAMA